MTWRRTSIIINANKYSGGITINDIKFAKEPAYTYDLLTIFILWFNRDNCLGNYINNIKSSQEIECFDEMLLEFGDIPNELLPFFYARENGGCFMTKYYFSAYKNIFLSGYNLSKIQTDITNYEKVVSNMINYYFPDLDNKMLDDCKTSIKSIGKIIKESKYNDTVKSGLYSFFINPIPVIQMLSYELMTKEFILSQKYEKNYNKIAEMQNNFNMEQYFEKRSLINTTIIDYKSKQGIYISPCLLTINCIMEIPYDNYILILLGVNYEKALDCLINNKNLPSLNEFGNAISERNRLDILDLILRKGEATIKDIEQELEFSGTNAYYHMTLMIKCNMIITRNRGRTIYYSLNKQYFQEASNLIKKYL